MGKTYIEWNVSFHSSDKGVTTVRTVTVCARTAFGALKLAHRVTGVNKAQLHEATVTLR